MSDSTKVSSPPFKKVLVCNRGEIAIRVFRSCTELGISTVAIFSHEDRFSLHRYKADEAYQVGKKGRPVQSYLDVDSIIAIAKDTGSEAIHPGYGFLSERAALRDAAEKAGIVFVGPSSETLEVAGDKVQTRALAESLQVPIIAGSEEIVEIEEAKRFAESCGYPVIVKAAHGGGGRGMRVVQEAGELAAALETAQSEALAAFGRAEVFIEKYVSRPKHVEVQLLGDGTGSVVHLYERDCSLQRRHQKVIEYAPAFGLKAETRETLHRYAIELGKALKLKAAATAEFLVDENENVYFIEINPRIQVEHTVTEEITGVDLVQSQLLIASGKTLPELDLEQEQIALRGSAIQCRITTENPTQNFMPDYGKLLAYRSASGFGIRLDAGSAFAGAVITPFYDSMLVKVTARGRDIRETSRRMIRALREFRIRGVSTNIAFLENLLKHESLLDGSSRTSFLEEFPEVFVIPKRRDRANRLLRFIAETSINGHELMPGIERPKRIRELGDSEIPHAAANRIAKAEQSIPRGWRDEFLELGKSDFLKKVREEQRLLITDTTFRDAHQSLLATRMRTRDMLHVARPLALSAPELFSLEMWGGATFDVMLRFLREDPWQRVSKLREEVPNILFQMLLRGANGVGYTSYPDNVVREFIRESNTAGIDIFRIFDSLNNPSRMRNAIEAVQSVNGIAEVCVCYTGDLLSEEKAKKAGEPSKFTIDYYTSLAKELASMGADIIAIKDMAGLLRAPAARTLVQALREAVELPLHLHTHDTAGVQSATYVEAAAAGVDVVDCAFSAMSGVTSQPSLEGLVGSLSGTERDTGLKLENLTPFSVYWENIRSAYAPFESDLRAPTAEVYQNEIPGGQYSNFRPQAESLGLGDRWHELKQAYAAVNKLLGGIVKVTPSSKVVGDFALFLVANDLSIEDVEQRAESLDFPASVVSFFQGEIGTPHGGFPEPLRTQILRGKERFTAPVSERLSPENLEAATENASALLGRQANLQDALSSVLYPHVFKEYAQARHDFGDVSLLPSTTFFYGLEEGEEIEVDIEPGKRLFISLIAISEPGENGDRTVFFELNGQPRSIVVRDRSIAPRDTGNEKADPLNTKQIGAQLSGVLVDTDVSVGDSVKKDDPLFTLEAMKMQTVVRAQSDGVVKRIALELSSRIEVGDLILEFE